MAPEYPYIAIAGNYYCTRCKLLSLVWIILFRKGKLHLGTFEVRRRQLPALLKAIRNFRNNEAAGTADTLTLPLPGHLCIPVHYGHKIFDFSGLTATKIFSTDVDPAVASTEINCVRDASSLPFTPALLEVDSGGRWYTERFVPGDRSAKTSRSNPQALFEQVICSYLAGIIQSKPVKTRALPEYLAGIHSAISCQLECSPFDIDLCSRIDGFVRRIADKLGKADDASIQLAFTHGDFSFVNFIYSKKITVIDWEGAKYRSALHDLYNYFLTELYYERVSTLRRSEIPGTITLLNQRLSGGGVQPIDTLADPDGVYRWLYYLERLQMLLDRRESSAQRNVILRSIDTFDHFETSSP